MDQSGQHIDPTPKHWWDKVKPYVEIAGVCLLAVYTLFTIKMYRVNKQAADAATSAALTAKNTLDSSNQSFKTQERAYVATTNALMATPPLCNVPGSKRVCIDIRCANSGRTPAVGNRIFRFATFGENAEKTIRAMVVPVYAKPDGGLFGNVGDQFGTAATDPVDNATAAKLISGDVPVYIYGVIQYFDVFGDYHETGYCYQHVFRSSAFIGCDFGNWFEKRPIPN